MRWDEALIAAALAVVGALALVYVAGLNAAGGIYAAGRWVRRQWQVPYRYRTVPAKEADPLIARRREIARVAGEAADVLAELPAADLVEAIGAVRHRLGLEL